MLCESCEQETNQIVIWYQNNKWQPQILCRVCHHNMLEQMQELGQLLEYKVGEVQ